MVAKTTLLCVSVASVMKGSSAHAEHMLNSDRCPFYDDGTIGAASSLDASERPLSKEAYHESLKDLDIKKLYQDLADFMTHSQACWPADGPQDGDTASYAGLFGRLAWHCSGSLRVINGEVMGGCEGSRQRYWPENEWRDNANLDKARALLGQIKQKYGNRVSWSDLMTFAGAVGLKSSGGPMKKFCFGRRDDDDGHRSVPLGVQGINSCTVEQNCNSDYPCQTKFFWPEQNETDNGRCSLVQSDGRSQGSHSVGLIYVYPEGPMLKNTHPDFDSKLVHNRSPRLSGLEVRDTFTNRMGWTDRETVALVGGGHTLGRTHGNCDVTGTKWAAKPYWGEGPHYEAVPGSGRGPTDGTCGTGDLAGLGPNTVSSGFEGAWTRTPSKWNYDFFHATAAEKWVPTKSPSGNDQWMTANRSSPFANTRRLTADMALWADEQYRKILQEYIEDPKKFDSDFADAWYKLVHRSMYHPHEDDLEKDANKCTQFEFLDEAGTIIV